jgi:hypothetical protein
MCWELELALEIVKPEIEEFAEERAESDFWVWNTSEQDVAGVVPGKKEPS